MAMTKVVKQNCLTKCNGNASTISSYKHTLTISDVESKNHESCVSLVARGKPSGATEAMEEDEPPTNTKMNISQESNRVEAFDTTLGQHMRANHLDLISITKVDNLMNAGEATNFSRAEILLLLEWIIMEEGVDEACNLVDRYYPAISNKRLKMIIDRKMKHLGSSVTSNPKLEDGPIVENVEPKLVVPTSSHVIIIDSDEENDAEQISDRKIQEIAVSGPTIQLVTDQLEFDIEKNRDTVNVPDIDVEDEGDEMSVGDDESRAEDDGLSDIWKEMGFALETLKGVSVDISSDDTKEEEDEGCAHSFIIKDDLGVVCRVCGIIWKAIENIIDFQYMKASLRRSDSRACKDFENPRTNVDGMNLNGHDQSITDISPHPRHKKMMKPHQLEGFNFLLSNLVTENPDGCILAHAPGLEITFMMISFMQIFLAKYPDARPLVVLPEGILPNWKKEFFRWEVEDIPLLDFFSSKADNRSQQSEVLKQWVGQRSILFLAYHQFSNIVSDDHQCLATSYCHDVLLKCPTIMIFVDGHSIRNDSTDMLDTLAKVQTPRKVVLSGTLYQNDVKEVFTILSLVRPKFLMVESSLTIMQRILNRIAVDEVKKNLKDISESNFFDLVEHTLQQDSDFRWKEGVINDLRVMTSSVMHYYRGDFLDDLPGLLDFTVLLKLMPLQNASPRKRSMCCYNNLMLKLFSDGNGGAEKNSLPPNEAIDEVIKSEDWRECGKAKFFFNVLDICESTNEKLLVFSQYLPPLKFLERMAICEKGYRVGKEIFVITGDTSVEQQKTSMEQFNTSEDARVFFGSMKACGEGISLVGASRVIILDVHLNPSVSRQALGHAFRPGQEKKVYVYRLVVADSPEEKDHLICFKKEQIAKRWFEWNECSRNQEFELEKVDPKDCGDMFLESDAIASDIQSLYTR